MALPFLFPMLATVRQGAAERPITQVIHAPASSPNASCQAGSRHWKYSSGWKNVRKVKAFSSRQAIKKSRTSPECGFAARRAFLCRMDAAFSLASGALLIVVESAIDAAKHFHARARSRGTILILVASSFLNAVTVYL